MRNEPDNQSSGKATAKIDRKTAAAGSTFRRGDEYPYDSDSDTAYHFSYFVQTGSRTVSCDSTPDSLMLVHCVKPLLWSTVTIRSCMYDALLP